MHTKFPPFIDGTGEYGATRIIVTKDDDMVRIAFGRSAGEPNEVYFLGVMLSPSAVKSLKLQLEELAV